MHDLDLDELDQAVNAMMDGRKRKKSVSSARPVTEDAVTVVRTGQTPMRSPEPRLAGARPARPDVRPSADVARPTPVNRAVEPAAQKPSLPRPQAVSHVASRKRARPGAMDIVQPAIPKVAPPSARPARVAAAVQPTRPVAPESPAPVSTEPVANSAPVQVTPSGTPSFTAPKSASDDVSDDLLASLALNDQPAHTVSSPTLLSDDDSSRRRHGWPDPLDFHDFDDGHKDHPGNVIGESGEITPSDSAGGTNDSTDSNADEPLPDTPDPSPGSAAPFSPSPFLTTKVEKRPLGAYADVTSQLSQAETDYLAQSNEPTPQPVVDSEPEPQPQIAEQSPELAPASQPQQSDQSAVAQSYQPSRTAQISGNQEASLDDLRSMSIPPQYHAPAREPNDDVRHLFDIKEYHAAPHPIQHAKQSDPWLTVVIVVLSVLALAVALVAYLMMTGFDFGGIL